MASPAGQDADAPKSWTDSWHEHPRAQQLLWAAVVLTAIFTILGTWDTSMTKLGAAWHWVVPALGMVADGAQLIAPFWVVGFSYAFVPLVVVLLVRRLRPRRWSLRPPWVRWVLGGSIGCVVLGAGVQYVGLPTPGLDESPRPSLGERPPPTPEPLGTPLRDDTDRTAQDRKRRAREKRAEKRRNARHRRNVETAAYMRAVAEEERAWEPLFSRCDPEAREIVHAGRVALRTALNRHRFDDDHWQVIRDARRWLRSIRAERHNVQQGASQATLPVV
jgi:hypothetical protein